MHFIKKIFIGIVLVFSSIFWADNTITVGIKSAPPFVILSPDKQASGFSIDIIKEVFRESDQAVQIMFRVDRDISSHLSSVEQKKVDLGIAATTVTFEREARMDFSQPFYYSGLGILVTKEQSAKWQLIFSQETLILLIFLGIYIIIVANFIWFTERKQKTFSRSWLSGVGEGAWWTIVTMSTVGYGDFSPRTKLGRLIAVFVIFSGIALFGIIIASFSSALTVDRMQNNIKNIRDTIPFSVAVVEGTTGQKYMEKIHPNLTKVQSLEEALDLLHKKQVSAIVHDIPILRFYTKGHDHANLRLVEGIFFPSAYAIAFPIGSSLRKKVNIRLLEVMESELYHKLIIKWFGKVE